jgi:RNA 3'-terminal phosphate cyclase (ATP)
MVTQTVGHLGLRRQLTIETRDLPSNGPGAAILLAVECEAGYAGFTALGARGLPMEQVAEAACRDFAAWWQTDAACDEHLADQLVLPLALANGESQWTTPQVTEHLRTVIWLVEQFLPVRFCLTAQSSDAYLVQVRPQ